MIKKISDKEFKNNVLEHENISIVVFASTWSGSSLLIEKHLKKIVKPYNGLISICKINVEQNTQILEEFSLYRFPSTLFFINGELVDILVGLFSKKNLDEVINNIIKNL